ncbi:PAS domain S-box protein [Chamaesiphon sp. VAR_48_metabat_135_sub]|uniref:PAS domain S-box protein n=1 Tax=Chamaesiphon sp. VAR_48_metabat_135_sub TaxID=2964699 RepID=UPI00286ACF32|nr:PAS domain S-box protein [Chamaesiphon sp. VAR_48_metabat_135_sub]
MPTANLSQSLPSLRSIVDRQPLIVAPDLPLVEVISLMSQAKGHTCLLPNSERNSSEARLLALEISAAARHSSVLVIADRRLVGIFTERDLVKLTASQTDLQSVTVGDVMTADPITLVLLEQHTVMTALAMFQQHDIRHLPILDDREQLIGIVTPEHIRQVLQPINLLKFKSVSEGMTSEVIHALPTTTVLEIVRMMNDAPQGRLRQRNIGSIVIVDGQEPPKPVGIITERDILQFQAFELDLDQLLAAAVMSSPLFCLQPTDSLWAAQQIMQTKNIRRLVITNDLGELAGILTQSDLLQLLDPLEMLYMVDSLQSQLIDRATELEQINQELQVEITRRENVEAELRRASQTLADRVVERTAESALLTEELHVKIAEQQSCDLALEASQQGISDFIENALIGMHWVDVYGDIVWVNQAELNMFGYDRSAYIGQPLINFHVDRAKITDILQRVSHNESIKNCEAQVYRKDGSICDVSLDVHAFFKDGKFIHARCFTRDITEQKNAEAIVKSTLTSLQFQKYALDRSAIVAATDREGTIVSVNEKFCEISQYSAAELIGKTHRVINSGYHPPEFFRDLWAVITSGKVWSGEIKNRAKDGSYYWVATTIVPCLDESGQPFQYLSIHFDITDRKQAEESVRQNELKFRAIFDGTFQFVGLLDNQGILLEANRTALEAIGVTQNDVVGQAFWATPWWTHSPDLQVQLQQAVIQAATGELVRFEAKHFLADGSYIIVDFSLSPIFDDTGKVVMLIPEGRDISDRKRMETELQVSESRYRALVTTAPVGIFQTDVVGNTIFLNQQCLDLMGVPLAAALGQDWINSLHPDDRAWVSAQWDDAVQANREFITEHRFRTPQGCVNWVFVKAIGIYDEVGIVTGYIGTVIDITDRKAAAQKIQEQAALLNVTTDAIIVQDLDRQIQFWNNGAESIYGWKSAEAMGLNTDQLFYTDVPPEVAIAAQTVRQKGSWQGELHKLTKTGREVIVESRWTLIRDDAGNPTSMLSVDTDITAKKQLEQQFLRAQRLESLGSLASGIAHDLNNVLTPIVGAAQLLPLTLPNLDARSQRLLNMLVESSKRGSGLVKQILTFARGMDGERTVLQVRHILSEIISVARQTFPKSISINLNLDSEDLWLVSVDATQIHQVLMNLFVNARDAMPHGGEISASAENITIDAADTKLHLKPPVGSYILMTISDTGIGMTSEMLEQIFNPFFTTKATGTGLGLSTVQGIVKTHGGSIDVESEVGQGTCFKIYLPAIDSREAETPMVDEDLYDGKGQLVLVVDDEAAIREITKESLETYNYRVMLASDGIEAIDIYAQNHHSIAIVLVDLMMPNLDTPSIILTLKQINPAVKIVVMSGSYLNLAETIDKQKVSAFLTKPFTTVNMLQILANIQTK